MMSLNKDKVADVKTVHIILESLAKFHGIWLCWMNAENPIELGGLNRDALFEGKYLHQGFHQVWYQGGVKATVSGVVEDLKLKISEGSDQNWCFPESAQLAVSAKLRQLTGQTQENTNFGRSLLKF